MNEQPRRPPFGGAAFLSRPTFGEPTVEDSSAVGHPAGSAYPIDRVSVGYQGGRFELPPPARPHTGGKTDFLPRGPDARMTSRPTRPPFPACPDAQFQRETRWNSRTLPKGDETDSSPFRSVTKMPLPQEAPEPLRNEVGPLRGIQRAISAKPRRQVEGPEPDHDPHHPETGECPPPPPPRARGKGATRSTPEAAC